MPGGTAPMDHPFDVAGRVAIITGAASGIGKVLTGELAALGMKVIAVDRDAALLSTLSEAIRASEGSVVGVVADVTQADDIRGLVDKIEGYDEGCDVWVNNAGVSVTANALDLDIADWDRILAVNLTGSFRCSQAAARLMIKRGKGSIINITSQLGVVARPGRAAYCVSKAGLVMLTKALAVDLAPYDIRVNAIAPGPIETARTIDMLYDPDEHDSYMSRMLVRRFGQPQDLLGAVLLLASDASSFMTGTTVYVDGGYLTT